MKIWIPDKLYNLIPWICIAVATLAWFVPSNLVAIACSVVLYGYGGWVILRRGYDLARYGLYVLLAWIIFGTNGCGPGQPAEPTITDQCLRRQIFKECMNILPAGPVSTHYNDWDEVVSECGSVAYYQSLRVVSMVKPECRSSNQ